MITATLPIELTNGNAGRGYAQWASAKRRKQYESILRLNGHTRTPLPSPVNLRIVRILGKGQRLWDADSVLRGSAKELIDALVACGWFHDDGPQWIHECVGQQDTTQRASGPATRIEASVL